METKTTPKVYHYTTRVVWDGEKHGAMTVSSKPDVPKMGVASPPEFKGHPGYWTPEDMLVSAVNSCTMMTFLTFAKKTGLAFLSYECEATGTLEMSEGKFRFTEIVLDPKIVVSREEDIAAARAVFESAEENCLIANSLRTRVTGEPRITVGS
jgi:peroxiredoxin-like protein